VVILAGVYSNSPEKYRAKEKNPCCIIAKKAENHIKKLQLPKQANDFIGLFISCTAL
jgi:hypothetical protein